ncbi:hypothetical protein [Aureibacter tunicatorum]|uniref:Lipoprotein n=1 Tax=Aureibacter tunicatorum TaxID=866807 RepID=A0AAE3XLD4_9BACT|nr:hypothetical protein [Aureibacter tunicatorum]MDR6239012.1 hypothetical protein [Aureibacter tunicatorum]BDD05062.1 hypothetical protein AUTU_25450 [Aureibacter tunicatorum]
MRCISRIYIVPILFALISCQKTVTCPAYQSAFILDEGERLNFFSTMTPEGEPKVVEVKKDKKTGIAKNTITTKVKNKLFDKFNTIPMYPDTTKKDATDSIPSAEVMAAIDSMFSDELLYEKELAENSKGEVLDSTTTKYHYNWDQYIYMLHFAEYLPDPEPEKEEEAEPLDVTFETSATDIEGISSKKKKKKKKDKKKKEKKRKKSKKRKDDAQSQQNSIPISDEPSDDNIPSDF